MTHDTPILAQTGNSAHKWVLLAIAGAIWIIGGNLLVAFHYQRRGKSPFEGFRPFAFPFKDFDEREWVTLILLLVAGMAFGIAGIESK